MSSECEGCNMYEEDLKVCGLAFKPHLSETQECPCLTCLVKVMCGTTCNDYDKYRILSEGKRVEDNHGRYM